jgi:hypothetical protein
MKLFNLVNKVYAQASSSAGCTPSDFGCLSKNDPFAFTSAIYTAGLGLIGGLALLFIIYGSFIILSSKGDPLALQRGKSFIVYSIIGMVLAFAGFAFYQIIAVDVIKIPGFSR